MADPNWSSVRLLLHFNGSNGSTTFTDSSADARTVTAVGSAALSTAQSQWGGASLSLNGTSGNRASVSMPAMAGDFTVEGWAYLNAAGTGASRAIVTAPPFELYRQSGGTFRLYKDGFGTVITGGTFSDSAWHHVAWTRSGSATRIFLDGVLQSTWTDTTSIAAGTWFIGEYAPSGGEVWHGYLDDIRVTVGVARYTANFTPPAAEFEDSSSPEVRVQGRTALGPGAVTLASVLARISGSSALGSGAALAQINNVRVTGGTALGTGQVLAASVVARAQGTTALGPGSVRLGEPASVRVAGSSALGAGAVQLASRGVRVQGSTALGTGRALATAPSAIRVTAASPLGPGRALAWHDFTGAVSSADVIAYVMDLVTPGGAVRVPISSWQATLDTDASGFVQCVVPAVSPWVDAILQATEFVVSRQARRADGSVVFEYEMARAPLAASGVTYDRGPTNWTATLRSYTTALTPNNDPPAVYDRELVDIRSTSTSSGGTRVRCAIDWLLRPGHRAYLDGLPLVVDYINFYVPGSDQYMDVGERI